ncbi:MAG TPA: hypothetical protein VGP46_11335 [Acidimicrobiales bacterium]|nr:hypothetical protein [Acidimicrobiales bacterium]
MVTPSFFRPLTAEFSELGDAQSQELVTIVAADGAKSRGVLYLPAGRRPRAVSVFTHPSADLLQYWTTLDWLDRGFAVFTYTTRYVNNYTDCSHELLVLDVGGVMRFLRDRGFEHVILFGKSGGGSLLAYYQAQASLPKGERVSSSPWGGGPDLNEVELPAADGLILLAAHPGQGAFLERIVDPSVIDEANPIAADWRLDMYDERNGWRRPPESSSYDPEWLARYRAAQSERVGRLDAVAFDRIESARLSADLLSAAGTGSDSARRQLERQSQTMEIMVVHRTGANPTYCDLSLEPNDRRLGSYLSPDAHLHNYGFIGFGRLLTPWAWLSTWSGHTSFANLCENLRHIGAPTFIVGVSADEDIYPSDFERQSASAAAEDKSYAMIEGVNHALLPVGGGDAASTRQHLMEVITEWSLSRFEP